MKKYNEKMVSVPEGVLREVFKQERDGQISCNCSTGIGAIEKLRKAAGIGEDRSFFDLRVSFSEDIAFLPGEDPEDTSTYLVKVYSKKGGELLWEGEPDDVYEAT